MHFSRKMFGKDFKAVHKAMDSPAKRFGPRHRRFFHTYAQAASLASMVSKDPDAPRAAMWHVWLDEKCSADPYYESYVELRAKLDSRNRRLRRKLYRSSRW